MGASINTIFVIIRRYIQKIASCQETDKQYKASRAWQELLIYQMYTVSLFLVRTLSNFET